LENYIDGDIDFFFEQVSTWGHYGPKKFGVYASHSPNRIAMEATESRTGDGEWEVGNLTPDSIAGEVFVICHWGERAVLIVHVELVDEIQKAVPSSIR
jgi:hypothetical protein